MATSNQNQIDQVGGPYMVQDMDHMVDSDQSTVNTNRKGTRQSEQAQNAHRQPGGDHGNSKPRRQAQ